MISFIVDFFKVRLLAADLIIRWTSVQILGAHPVGHASFRRGVFLCGPAFSILCVFREVKNAAAVRPPIVTRRQSHIPLYLVTSVAERELPCKAYTSTNATLYRTLATCASYFPASSRPQKQRLPSTVAGSILIYCSPVSALVPARIQLESWRRLPH